MSYPKEITDQFELTDLRMGAEYHSGVSIVPGGEEAWQLGPRTFRLRVSDFTGDRVQFQLEHIADEDENGEPCRFFKVCYEGALPGSGQ